jgi:prepilin-type N-terminal cleavage/methylation domain-containing protein
MRTGERGFSLIEAVIALAIAGVVLTAFYDTIATGLMLDRRSREKAAAQLLATDLLDRIGHEIQLVPGIRVGETRDGFRWTMAIEPDPFVIADGRQIATNRMMRVVLRIDSRAARIAPITVETLRVTEDVLR